MIKTVKIAAMISFVAAAATATTFLVPTDRRLIEKSAAIVVGTVERSHVRMDASDADAGIETVYDIRVQDGMKGPLGRGQLFSVVSPGGEIAGRGLHVPGAARFDPGERVLLFLTRHKEHWETTDLMLGKMRFLTSRSGVPLLLRDEPEDGVGMRRESARDAARFLRFIDDVLALRPASDRYFVESVALQPATEALVESNVAPYAPESYTQKGSSPLGVRWDPAVAASGLNFYRRSGCTGCDPAGADAGISNGMNSWNGECGSLLALRLAGTTATRSGATNAECQICDRINVIEFNDPQDRLAGGWGGSGTIAVTYVVFNSVSSPNVGPTFRELMDSDIVFQNGYNPATESSFPTAITHELGHSIGFRHSNASPANPNDSASSCNSATEECASNAIMFWRSNAALGYTLQQWDVNAAQAVYPGGTCGAPTPPPPTGSRTRNDFNGDGRADILIRDASGSLGVWFMNGPAIAGGSSIGSPGGSYTVAGIGDFNNDGRADILLRDLSGNLGMWLMNGAIIAAGAFVGSPGGSYTVAGIGDFNGDGFSDILLRDAGGTLGMWLMTGASIAAGGLVGSPGSYSVAGVGDFNGDGRSDILLRDSSGSLGIWFMNGATIAGGAAVGSPGGSYAVVGVADFNADGRADILLRDGGGTFGMWLMNGSTIAGGGRVGSASGSTVAATNDYNGDRMADILLRDSSGGVGMWIMNGVTVVSGSFVGSPGTTATVY